MTQPHDEDPVPPRTRGAEERDRRHGEFTTAEEAMEAVEEADGRSEESAYSSQNDEGRPPG